jgi:glutamate/tyrosine decarboxylase-like PLP-dependent enzyme
MELPTIALIVSTANGSAAIVLAVLQIRDRWRDRHGKEEAASRQ